MASLSSNKSKQFSEVDRAIMSRQNLKRKAESRAHQRPLQLAVLGRHDNPEIPEMLSNPETGHWLFQNVFQGETRMAAKKKPQTQGVQPTVPPASQKKKSTKPMPDKESAQKSPMPETTVAGRQGGGHQGGGRSQKTQTTQPKTPKPSTGGSSNESVDKRLATTKRAIAQYNTAVTTAFPQQRDLFMYGVKMNPAGTVGSVAREHFENSLGLGVRTSIKRVLPFKPASAITNTHLADYFNTVAQAYFVLLSVGNHFSVLNQAKQRPSLRLRADLIFNDESVPYAIKKLAKALTPHYLPPKFITEVEKLAKVYFVDKTPLCPMFQLVSWAQGTDTDANYVDHVNTARTNVDGMTNAEDIITAFSHERWKSDYIQLSRLKLAKYDDPDNFIDQYQKNVSYNTDMLDIWTNMPLEAGTGLVNKRYLLADGTTTLYRAVFGSGYTSLSNVLSANYVTSDSQYQPGVIVPERVDLTTGNNFRYVSTTGDDEATNITSVTAVQFGVLSRMVDQVYDTTNTLRILPSGSTYVSSNMNNVAEDTSEVLDALFGNSSSV